MNPTSFTVSYQDLPDPGIGSISLTQGLSPALQADSLSLEPSGTSLIILKTIEYAQSFQVMYVILKVNIEIIILVKKLNSQGPFSWGICGGGSRLLGIYYRRLLRRQYQARLQRTCCLWAESLGSDMIDIWCPVYVWGLLQACQPLPLRSAKPITFTRQQKKKKKIPIYYILVQGACQTFLPKAHFGLELGSTIL